MRAATLVDATDLDAWADRRSAQHDFPRLVRRLVHSTAQQPSRIQFRAGEGVQLGGWDGLVVAGEGDPWVPEGLSAWELSASSDLPGKPNCDYENRTGEPGDVDPEVSTFVFVTPRRWPGKDGSGGQKGWAAQRREGGPWRDVRAYDADDLESWLVQAPAVHVWLSIRLGKHPTGARDLETFWNEWSGATAPPLSQEFVLAGRQKVADQIVGWLRDPANPSLGLQAESESEALGVFAAVVSTLPEDVRTAQLARTLVVDDARAWRQLFGTRDPLVLIPRFQDAEALAGALQAGHQVLVPTGPRPNIDHEILEIPRLARDKARDILMEDGFKRGEAEELATEAHRSLSAFRRARWVALGVPGPPWATPEHGRDLVPALLTGGWNENNEYDRSALARLTEGSYSAFRDGLVRWSREDDPPVRQRGDTWLLASKEDAWQQLSQYLTRSDLERFEEVAQEILGESDPRYDLPQAERWMAGAMGASPEHSGLLRKQVANTVSLLGARGDSVQVGTGVSARDFAQRVVRSLYDEAEDDWSRWASLSPHFPQLAEAAPDVFANALSEDLGSDEPVLRSLFIDQDHTLFSSSPHTHVLWALETIAWSEEHLGQAAELLTRLAALDPGGKLTNRPANSLREIFLLWKPGTAAGVDRRSRILNHLCDRHPEVGWSLLMDLLPRHHDTSHPTSEPQWRAWQTASAEPVTRTEYDEALERVVTSVLDHINDDGNRWADVIEALPRFPSNQLERVVEQLSSLDTDGLREEDQVSLWHSCRELLSQHRTRLDQGGLVPEPVEKLLQDVFTDIEPDRLVDRYAWLFANGPALPEGRRGDWEEHDRAVRQAQTEAIIEIYTRGGMAEVLEFATSVERPEEIGRALGQAEVVEAEEPVLANHLASEDAVRARLARGFAATCFRNRDRDWAEDLVANDALSLEDEQKVELLLLLPADARTWELASEHHVGRLYWSRVQPRAVRQAEYREQAALQLLDVQRPYAATELASIDRHREAALPHQLIIEILDRVVEAPPAEDDHPSSSFAHHVSELMMDLAEGEIEDERIAQLEWGLLPLLDSVRYKPKQLHQYLANHPEFFAELISLAYAAEGEEGNEVDDDEAARARNAHDVLRSWSSLPGTADDGTVGSEELQEWVGKAHAATMAAGRETTGLIQIGKVLSASPKGADEVWPHPAVRDVIEKMGNADLEQGLVIGRINSRGVVSRDPRQGGDPERALAEQYSEWAREVSGRWPRTGRVLRSLADSYRRDAEREDYQTALWEDLD